MKIFILIDRPSLLCYDIIYKSKNEEVQEDLQKNEKDFKIDVSIKTIKNICQLLECCLEDIMD